MRQKRSDPDIKQKESKSSKTNKHNKIIYGKKLKRIKRNAKKTKSNSYTENENINKRTNLYNSLYKDKETKLSWRWINFRYLLSELWDISIQITYEVIRISQKIKNMKGNKNY